MEMEWSISNMMHAANTVTELHITWVDVLTAKMSTRVQLLTVCSSEWLIASNFVISFYFLVSFDQTKDTAALNVALNCVSLQPKCLQAG
jgi:hypothetical protein